MFRIRIIRVAAWAWISKTAVLGRDSLYRSSSARKYICVANWGCRTIFIKNAVQEVAEKLKKREFAPIRKEITKNNEDWKNFLRSTIRNHEQWVYSFTILIYWAVMTDLRSSSSSCYYLEFKKPEPRSWNAAKYTREWVFLETFLIVNMLDEILMNCSIIQEFWQHHEESLMISRSLRKEGIETSGSEEPLQSIPLPCFSVRARRKIWTTNKSYVDD